MRIPTSLVVMSCVTALPFGLAIRDTVRHSPRGSDMDLTGERARAREAREKAQLEEARAQAEYEAALRERDARLDALFGKTIASRGTSTELSDDFDNYDGTATFQVHSDECQRLQEKLETAWGPGSNHIWLNPATHERAAYSTDLCTLQFDTFLEPQTWVANLPIDMIGASKSALEAKIDNSTDQLDQIEWQTIGIGAGRGPTRISAQLERDKVVGINVIADSDLDTQDAIRTALSERLKVDAGQDPNDPLITIWKSSPPVRLDVSGGHRFSVQIGKLTWQ